MRKYYYLIVFVIGFVLQWPFVLHKLYIEQEKSIGAFAERQENADKWPEEIDPGPEQSVVSEVAEGEDPGKSPEEESVEEPSGEREPEEGAAEEPSGEEPEEEEQDEPEEEELSPEEFFQNTLFIGDSRTMGLAEYADLTGAVVFANTGMNIYRLYSLKNGVRDQEAYLEDVLAKNQFRKIYLMLGINELGYDEGQTVKRFEEEVLKLRELQPEAKIVLEANLHVTSERSERDEIFNNEGIDRINGNIRQIAEKYGFSYIDVNEIFDDETGGLNAQYTHDEVHVLGKYYQQWADWIRENKI